MQPGFAAGYGGGGESERCNPETYRAFGEALERLDRGEEALQVYEQGLRVAVDQETPYGDPVEEYRTKARQLR